MKREDLLRPLGAESLDVQTSFRLTSSLFNWLATYASSIGVSRSQLLVKILLVAREELEQ